MRTRRPLTQVQKFRWDDLSVRIDDLEKPLDDMMN
jgi:hypothetical protein